MSDETEGAVDQDAMADDWAAAMEEQTGTEEGVDVDIDSINEAAKPVELDELSDDGMPLGDPKLDVILDIPVTLSMEVGSTDIAIRNLLSSDGFENPNW